jgi:glycosyltransferase involved in cell wall biosynthesis
MNSKSTPTVSIGLPVYNGEKFLHEAIESVLSQTVTDFELIICDNASTDRTEEICSSYARQDARVRYQRNQTNVGGANNANLTVQLATGRYFLYFADDDVLDPGYLERCLQVLETWPDIILCYSLLIDIDETGRQLRITKHELGLSADPYQRFVSLIQRGHYAEAIYGLMRLDILRQTRLEQNYSHSDRTLLCELALRGRFYQIQTPLFHKRLHKRNVWLDHYSRMAWFNPALVGTIVFPSWIQFFDFLVTIHRTNTAVYHKLRCYLYMLGPYLWAYAPRMIKDIMVAVYMSLKTPAWRANFYKQRDNWSTPDEIPEHSTSIDWFLDKTS